MSTLTIEIPGDILPNQSAGRSLRWTASRRNGTTQRTPCTTTGKGCVAFIN